MTRILIREGAAPWVSGFFFKAVVQAVLIFGSKTWAVTPRMGEDLGVFQVKVSRRLKGWLLQQKPDKRWTYTSTAMARVDAGFLTMED